MVLDGLAAELGADVPSQLVPVARACPAAPARGSSGSRTRRPTPPSCCPAAAASPPPTVFAEADRLGLGRDAAELEELAARLREAAGAGASPLAYAELLANDLEPAARSLRPEIGEALDALRDAGAPLALLTGSGPTAFGLFHDMAAARAGSRRSTATTRSSAKLASAP